MITLPVKNKDLVLEIGSGHNPHPRANILCDRALSDNEQRQRFDIRYDRPLVIASGEHLPFKDKSFDFVYCSQILEHVKDPQAFINEVVRIGKSGMFIVPSILRERLFGWYYHQWFFYQKDGNVYYLPKEREEQTQFAHFIHMLFAHNLTLRRYLSSFEQELNVYHSWKGKPNIFPSKQQKQTIIHNVDVRIGELLARIEYSHVKDLLFYIVEWREKVIFKIDMLRRVINWKIKLKLHKKENIAQLQKYLCCPSCHNYLIREDEAFLCSHCSTRYPVVQGVPNFLLAS